MTTKQVTYEENPYALTKGLVVLYSIIAVLIIAFGLWVGWFVSEQRYLDKNQCVLVHKDPKEKIYFCWETGETIKR